MIRIMIADDHQIMREGLRKLLATVDGVEVDCEAADGTSLLEKLSSCGLSCNLLIMDLSMPGGGIELIQQVRLQKPELPILVLSMHNEGVVANRALNAGASGYVTKDCDADTLILAVMQVGKGRKFIDPSLVDVLQPGSGRLTTEKLSEREREILLLLVKGRSVTEISKRLDISIKTVSTHKSNLMTKLNIENNADLVRYGIDHGLTI